MKNTIEKKTLFSIFGAIFITILATGCAKKSMEFATTEQYKASGSSINTSKRASKVYSDNGAMYDMEEEALFDAEYTENPSPKEYERKLILTGNINLEVTSLEDARNAVDQLVKQLGGYIADSSEWSNGITITIRVPSSQFSTAMNTATGIGKIRSKNINSSDVTDQYYDLDTRLTTKKVMLERLETYLNQSKDIKDMIEIESKINEVTSDIEVMQGQLNRLSSLISYSTITISANLPVNQTQQGFVMPDAKSKFREFARDVVYFFVQFFFVILYVIIYGIPILATALLLYWLLIGKIGILRKIFNKIKARKNSQD